MPPRARAELAELRTRLGLIADLRGAEALLGWDQNTFMPPGGAEARADQLATLERLAHQHSIDPALGRLLEALEPWLRDADPESDDACIVRRALRDYHKAARIPLDLAEAMAREAAHGYTAWLKARETGEFVHFQDALAVQLELRRRYAELFPEAGHPYDPLLDDFEPGATTAELRPLFAQLVQGLRPLVEAAEDPDAAPNGGLFSGRFDIARQRELLLAVLGDLGYDERTWRLDTAPHPFAQSPGYGDVRLTTRYAEGDLAFSFYSAVHEFGHGLYEAMLPRRLFRTNLFDCASLGVHESQSRLWENIVGRGRPFCHWVLPRLREHFPEAFDGVDADELYRGVNVVQRTLIRTESDETTYNLHIALRFELELALIEGSLEVVDLPAAWNTGMYRVLGIKVPEDRVGVLQDVHWATGLFGYFPTYTLGNLMSAQLWSHVRTDLGDVDGQIERGDFGPLREWLREHVHEHGRRYLPRDLLRRATGEELSTEPLVAYLRAKLADAGLIGG